jgi:hypothetical protein
MDYISYCEALESNGESWCRLQQRNYSRYSCLMCLKTCWIISCKVLTKSEILDQFLWKIICLKRQVIKNVITSCNNQLISPFLLTNPWQLYIDSSLTKNLQISFGIDMIYLITAIGLALGGSSTVHIYTQTVHRTTQWSKMPRTEHI